MANILDIKDKKLSFVREQYTYKLEFFKLDKMTIDTMCYKGNEFIRKETIPFAQIPKKFKKLLNPKK